MKHIKVIVTPDMHPAIHDRADEIRAFRHAHGVKPDSQAPITGDLAVIGVECELYNLTGKIRYIGRTSHQAEYVTDKSILVIPLDIPGCNHPDLETCVKIAKEQLGDIFPNKFDYVPRLVRIFQNVTPRKKEIENHA